MPSPAQKENDVIDINELRRLAQAASHPTTKGRWIHLFGERTVYDRMEDGCRGIPVVSTDKHPPSPAEAACLDFIAAANPATVIELLDHLEAAEEERRALRAKVEAMERQEPVVEVQWAAGIPNSFLDFISTDGYLPKLGDKLYALPGVKGE